MKSKLKVPAMLLAGFTLWSASVNAAIVTINVSGVAISTAAEQQNPGVWGVDAYGNNIIGANFTAAFTFDTSLGTILNSGGTQSLSEPGQAIGNITIGGHTYQSTGISRADYIRSANSIGLTLYDDQNADTGIVITIPINTQGISPNLDAAIPTITLADADVAKSGLDAIVPVAGIGTLRADLQVTSFSVQSTSSTAPNNNDGFLFYRNDGSSAVTHIDANGILQQTDSKAGTMTQNWSQIVEDSYTDNLLFYRNDGIMAVGHIDLNGKLQQTDTGANFTQNWSIIVATSGNFLFYRNDGSAAVAHVDQNGKLQQTD